MHGARPDTEHSYETISSSNTMPGLESDSAMVGYVNADGLDAPVGVWRGTSSGTVGTMTPHVDWRGAYALGTWDDGSSNPCTGSAPKCSYIAWPAVGMSAARGHPLDVTLPSGYWMGSLLSEATDGSGLQYKRNRYYDPASGRFTQVDPIGLAGGLNAYGFGGGDQVNFSDPFGLSCKDSHGRDAPCPDKDKVAKWMQENAGMRSQGKCANFCRRGLEAGGFDSSDRPTDAGDYGPFLRSRGAEVVSEKSYVPERGDIVVFQKTKEHPNGHIAIYDGKQWISDFKQKHMIPYRDPQSVGEHTIYRFPDN